MDQPVPNVSEADVARVVRRDYPSDRFDEVMAVLSEYGTEDWQHGPHRVRLATLKLAHGSLASLRQQIDVAKCDYRDVLAYAEYPEYMTEVPPAADPSDQRVQNVITRDWSQYQRWLKATTDEQPDACD